MTCNQWPISKKITSEIRNPKSELKFFVSLQFVMQKILDIENLSVQFTTDGVPRTVVDGVSYSVVKGRTLGIVGESGSGKSVSSMAILQLLPEKNCQITNGRINYYVSEKESIDLLSLDRQQMELYRGKHISMIFQEPMTSLNPVHKCGRQVMEMIRIHEKVTEKEARARTLQLFNEVQLPRPEKIFDSYPHQISGGQKQRVMIAMALACHPEVLIADEPTTALDVTVQKGILELLRKLQKEYGMGIIFITHDLGVVAQIADDIDDGLRIGDVEDIFILRQRFGRFFAVFAAHSPVISAGQEFLFALGSAFLQKPLPGRGIFHGIIPVYAFRPYGQLLIADGRLVFLPCQRTVSTDVVDAVLEDTRFGFG